MKDWVVASDFDGTIADSMPHLEALAVELAVWEGINPDEARMDYRATIGHPFRDQVNSICSEFSDADKNAIAREFDDRRLRLMESVDPFPGAKQAFEELMRDQVAVFVVSSSPRDVVGRWLHRNGISVTGHYGIEDGRKNKQLLTIKERTAHPHLILLGDSPSDAEYAEAAGIQFLGVRQTFPRAAFGVYMSVPTIKEVPTCLRAK